MKTLLITLLISSCSHYQHNGDFYHKIKSKDNTRHFIEQKKQIGIKCPDGTYYSFESELCEPLVYINAQDSINGVQTDVKRSYESRNSQEINLKPSRKPVYSSRSKTNTKAKPGKLTARIDCKEVLSKINQCTI